MASSAGNPLLSAALAYAGRGWPVFPCKARGKAPATKRGLKDATTDPAVIREWWRDHPRANVAVVTGAAAGLFVLDIDVDPAKGEDGNASLAELERVHGPLPTTVEQRTPRGGRHLLFRHPGGKVKNSAKQLGAGLDVRGDGGYIVAAPSVHPNGGRYDWSPTDHPDQVEIAAAPAWLLELVTDKARPRAQAPARRPRSAVEPAAGGYARRALEDECRTVSRAGPGTRNPALNAAAFNLGQLVGGGALDREAVEAALYQAAEECGLVADDGAPATLRTIASGLTAGMARPRQAPERQPMAERRSPAAGAPAPADEAGRPSIYAADGDLNRITGAAWSALHASNDPPRFYRYGDAPTRVETNDHGMPKLVTLDADRMRGELARAADFYKTTKAGEIVPAHPPMDTVHNILALPDPDLPILYGVVTAPVFGADGVLRTAAGYHPGACLVYRPPPGFTLPAVPARPSEAQRDHARRMILEELLGDFPFVGEAERAHAVALLLLQFIRPMIDGPTPLHLIEKPSPGTGATLMIDAIATVASGASSTVMTEAGSEDEWRKRITATLRDNAAVVLIDNLRRRLDSSALAAAITAPVWSDRILGVSDNAHLPVRCAWVATGNNPSVSNELARRIVRIRLDARQDRPWQRQGFRHPNLLAFARARRAELVWSVLVLVQDWISAGRPPAEYPASLGMFESWAETIGGILEHAGITGFLGNLDEFYDTADAEAAAWRAFIAAWWDKHLDGAFGVSDLYQLAAELDVPLDLGDGGERSQRIRLGKQISAMRDRQFSVQLDNGAWHDLRICAGRRDTGAHSGSQLWRLERVGP